MQDSGPRQEGSCAALPLPGVPISAPHPSPPPRPVVSQLLIQMQRPRSEVFIQSHTDPNLKLLG